MPAVPSEQCTSRGTCSRAAPSASGTDPEASRRVSERERRLWLESGKEPREDRVFGGKFFELTRCGRAERENETTDGRPFFDCDTLVTRLRWFRI